jgi:hypothetical protein
MQIVGRRGEISDAAIYDVRGVSIFSRNDLECE